MLRLDFTVKEHLMNIDPLFENR